MTSYATSTISYKRAGVDLTAMVQHPAVDAGRKAAVDYFTTHGCRIVADSEHVLPWLAKLELELQEAILSNHLELTALYSLHIPETATIESGKLELLSSLADLKHLSIAYESIRAEDMRFLGNLTTMEILTLIGPGFADAHVAYLPDLPKIRMLDVQTTSVTAAALKRLQETYPNATLYSP